MALSVPGTLGVVLSAAFWCPTWLCCLRLVWRQLPTDERLRPRALCLSWFCVGVPMLCSNLPVGRAHIPPCRCRLAHAELPLRPGLCCCDGESIHPLLLRWGIHPRSIIAGLIRWPLGVGVWWAWTCCVSKVYVTVDWLNQQATKNGLSCVENIIDGMTSYRAWMALHDPNRLPKNPEVSLSLALSRSLSLSVSVSSLALWLSHPPSPHSSDLSCPPT